jgi:toxin ParE1/3/4
MKISWSDFASDELKNIYNYYKETAGTKVAKKIKDQLLATPRQLLKYSESGQVEENLKELKEGHRYLVQGKYKIIYKMESGNIYITDIFNCEKDPEKMRENAVKD